MRRHGVALHSLAADCLLAAARRSLSLVRVRWQAREAAAAAVRQRHAEQTAAGRQQPPEPDEPPPRPAVDEL